VELIQAAAFHTNTVLDKIGKAPLGKCLGLKILNLINSTFQRALVFENARISVPNCILSLFLVLILPFENIKKHIN